MRIVVLTTLYMGIYCTLVSVAQAASALGTRGIATVMQIEDDSTSSGLEKRGGRGTWYSGSDLRNAACYDRKGLAPYHASTHSMIGAMAMNDFEQCYKCVKITNNRIPALSVIVKIVDKCAACKVGKAIDLTPAAFQKIAPAGNLGIGVLDITWKPVHCPRSRFLPGNPKGLGLF
ncbi:uncharacterized protein BYT42DRAFT_555735 [Radiomyces spectabilis]|uniref:uncharacterized protein n=1 Tax=Radiomyces spectabilis TaxID=64574 RepID=UPI00221FB9EA|nr:uncharacterized protein BYT42DRAFT_555735 [Radiomyces spectabilis]KAI8391133.1 hypothetical protein BYT42DRAFT_555735 [Radiomyces spectabilis]